MQPSISVQRTEKRTDPSSAKLADEHESLQKEGENVGMSKNQLKKQRRVKW